MNKSEVETAMLIIKQQYSILLHQQLGLYENQRKIINLKAFQL